MTPYHQIAKLAVSEHRALHHPLELAAVLGIMHDHEITTILETGTWEGGSAWAWLQVPSVTRVVSVDIHPLHPAQWLADEMRTWLTLVTGNSNEPATRARAVEALQGHQPDMVFIDGGHDYPTARGDWEWMSPMVRPGGLIVIHDTQGAFPYDPDFGVPQLWAEVMPGRVAVEVTAIRGTMFGTGIIWAGLTE